MRRAQALTLLLAGVLTPALAVPGAIANGDPIARAAPALRSDRVYVDPSAQVKLSSAQVRALERQIATEDPGRIFVALLPNSARAKAGGTVAGVGAGLERRVGRPGIYAIVVGSRFEAGSNAMARGEAGTLASVSFAAHHAQGVYSVLRNFVSLAARADPRISSQPPAQTPNGATPPASQPSSGANAGVVFAVILGAIFLVIALVTALGRTRRRRRLGERMAEVRKVAREDQLALGDDIRELDLDVSMPGADAGAKGDYAKALDCYEAAGKALDESSTLGVGSTIDAHP